MSREAICRGRRRKAALRGKDAETAPRAKIPRLPGEHFYSGDLGIFMSALTRFLSRCRAGMLGLHSFGDWGPGTFGSSEGSALEHFRKHGGDAGVRAKNLADYLRKASDALEA